MVNLQKEIVDTVVTPDAGIVEDLQLLDDLNQPTPPQQQTKDQDQSQEKTKEDTKLMKEIVDTVVTPVQQFLDELTDELPEVISAGLSASLELDGSSNMLNQNQETGGDEANFMGPGMPGPDGADSDEDDDEEQSTPSFSPIP